MKSIVVCFLTLQGFFLVDFAVSQVCPSNELLEVASGNLTSPLYPLNYPGNKTCSWHIKAPQGKYIKLKINTFNVQVCGEGCTCDYLQIAIGKTSTERSRKYCQRTLTEDADLSKPIYSIYNQMWLKFYSNNEPSNLFKGFYAQYEIINFTPPVCPADAIVYSDQNGTVRSPNYPNNYPDSTHCYWLVSVSANSRIKLSFKDFAVEETGCAHDPSKKCTCDYVKIYDGSNNSTLAELCGNSLPKPVVSGSNKMLIEFFSSSEGRRKGFNANYQLTDDPATKPEGGAGSTTAETTTTGLAVTSSSAGSFIVLITLLTTSMML